MGNDLYIPYSESRNVPKSDIYLRKNKPLAIPPWLTPINLYIKWLKQLCCLTRNLLLVYKLRILSITFPCQPHFMTLQNSKERLTISKAFEKSTKHKMRFLLSSICLCASPWSRHRSALRSLRSNNVIVRLCIHWVGLSYGLDWASDQHTPEIIKSG